MAKCIVQHIVNMYGHSPVEQENPPGWQAKVEPMETGKRD